MFEEDRVTEQCGLYAGWGIGGGVLFYSRVAGGGAALAARVAWARALWRPHPRRATPPPTRCRSCPRRARRGCGAGQPPASSRAQQPTERSQRDSASEIREMRFAEPLPPWRAQGPPPTHVCCMVRGVTRLEGRATSARRSACSSWQAGRLHIRAE